MPEQPFCSDSVNPIESAEQANSDVKSSLTLSDAKALPLEWLLGPKNLVSPVERVLARLVIAQAREVNPHFKDDYAQTWIAIYTADVKGEFSNGWDALVSASYTMYGLHPNKVWPKCQARRAALLGPAGEHPIASPKLPGISPKKPAQSITRTRNEEEA